MLKRWDLWSIGVGNPSTSSSMPWWCGGASEVVGAVVVVVVVVVVLVMWQCDMMVTLRSIDRSRHLKVNNII